jgi:hypothetical protein
MMKSSSSLIVFVVVVAMATLAPPTTVVDALLLQCTCVPFMVMFSKYANNSCFYSDWVRELVQNLTIPTLQGWQEAHPCGVGTNATTSETTGAHAFATSYEDSTNAIQEESEGYVAGSQRGYLTGMSQGFELGELLVK